MRPSQYNLIENRGERTLVMNAKTGAILSLDKQHAERMCRMVSGSEWEDRVENVGVRVTP